MGNLTAVVLVGFLFIHIAEILNIIAIATPKWLVSNETVTNSSEPFYYKGLWEFCSNNCTELNQTAQATWFRGSQALDVIGVGLGTLALILTYVFLLTTACRNSRGMAGSNATVQLIAGGSLLAVIILIAKNGKEDFFPGEFPTAVAVKFGWSYYVAVAGMVTMFIAAFATIREAFVVAKKRQEYENI